MRGKNKSVTKVSIIATEEGNVYEILLWFRGGIRDFSFFKAKYILMFLGGHNIIPIFVGDKERLKFCKEG